MIPLEAHAAGTLLKVRAHAGARQNDVTDVQGEELRVAVCQAAEKGKANKAIIAVLAAALKLKRSQLEIVAGETSPHKKIVIHGLTPELVAERISAALA